MPQFLNVLGGSMSLVGPRPPIPYEFECYEMWHRQRLVAVKPGITGQWQVGGRSRTTFDEMVRMDLKYSSSWTVWGDYQDPFADTACSSFRSGRLLARFPQAGPSLRIAGRDLSSTTREFTTMIRVGVIGYGYWGPGIVRNFHAVEGCEVAMVCDKSSSALKRAKQAYPSLEVTSDPCDILAATDIDAVAVITPVWTHFELAKGALEHGKHVFVEKPFTSTADQAEELIDLAITKNLQIMVDHTFLFTGAVKKIRQLINEGALGNLYYYDSTRVNLGLVPARLQRHLGFGAARLVYRG